jgi:tetratricopeptide (TPR) repeat protein
MNKDIVDIYNGIAIVHKQTGNIDSSIRYASEVLQKWRAISYQKGVLDATNILAQSYKLKGQKDSTIKYLEQSVALNNKLYNQEIQREILNQSFGEQARKEEIERPGATGSIRENGFPRRAYGGYCARNSKPLELRQQLFRCKYGTSFRIEGRDFKRPCRRGRKPGKYHCRK